jgi:hypothetical protein
MTRAPISGDMMVKLALAAAAIGLVYFGYRKLSRVAGAAGDALASIGESAVNVASTTLNPASTENAIYKGTNAIGSALVTDPAGPGKNADGSWSLGGWIYDVTHPDPMALPPSSPAGHTAYWKS